jgi:hypothetical protein
MNMMPFVYGWVVLVVVVLSLAIGRYRVARHDDQMLHLTDKEGALLTQQAVVERKLRRIDFWGQWLTVIAVLYGLALLEIYLHGVWAAGAKRPS